MRPNWRTLSCALGAGGLLLGVLAAGQGVAGASPVQRSGTSTCTGTLSNPGELSGLYENLDIYGVCAVQNGPVQVLGNVTIEPNASLNAVFGLKNSNLVVWGNMTVDKNAAVMMGCDTVFVTLWGLTSTDSGPEFPCIDDPNQSNPTLSSHDVIKGNLTAIDSLGVVLHNTQVEGNVFENGGGGGNNCINQGIFNLDIGFPQYSGFFDGSINGNLTVENVTTCWYGSFRMIIDGSMVTNNVVNNDPDGNEISANTIAGNMICQGDDSPAVQFGDSDGSPSKVGGRATGQCAFNVLAPNPAPEAGVIGVTPVLEHISVPWRL